MSPTLVWFLFGAFLMLAELFTPAFVIIFFGVGAWGAAVTSAVWPGLQQEIITFVVISMLCLLVLRKRMVNTFQGRKSTAKQNMPDFPHAGRIAEVTRMIPAAGEGEISLGGSFWRATSPHAIALGRQVKVMAPTLNDELLLMVEPIGSEEPPAEAAAQ